MQVSTLIEGSRKRGKKDPFSFLRIATQHHLTEHGCMAYPYDKGAFLIALAAEVAPRRALELGTALGYSALCIAYGAAGAIVDTVDSDGVHVDAARSNIERAGFAARVRVHHGTFEEVTRRLEPGYDLAFFDGWAPDTAAYLSLLRLVSPGGVVVSANLNLNTSKSQSYIEALHDERVWETQFVDLARETAISVRTARSTA